MFKVVIIHLQTWGEKLKDATTGFTLVRRGLRSSRNTNLAETVSPPLTLMLLALCYKNSGLFFNLKKNSQTRMVETRVTQAFISTHKASVAIRISALTCCISCHSRCLEASRPTRRGHLDSKLERREYFTLLSKRTSMNFRILRKNLDQGSVIIFYQ